ncbi:MAG: ribulose-phosphate 3-epimerase [Caldilineaceae bacterium]|nr:ribulose-phosphate 3-epimerase [Caldilineaceae bacterium]MCY4118104.1 ribulose-phosphate 3-epimerase [Caldilineaceae bacterium]MDE0072086.1 ribulose-phosphate 3-epimerase [Caldilineaceae bacterium]MDE0431686.1 ribulose-phosphate 3-epimerase [Caldilineaceae bacterium]
MQISTKEVPAMVAPAVKLAPSILTADFGRLQEEVLAAEHGGADLIHLDVMDGRFVPNITFGPLVVEAVHRVTQLPLDVHLMIEEPERHLELFAKAGASIITVHLEACLHLHRAVQQIVDLGCQVGVALNPSTPIESIREIAPFVDQVLVMSVNPGFGGQRFIQTMTSKLRRTRKLLDEYNPTCDLEVDGGIGTGNIRDVLRNGANVIVVGSAVYNSGACVGENLAALRDACSA